MRGSAMPMLSGGRRSQLQSSQDQPQHQVAVLSLSSNVEDHVHLSHDLLFASIVPEVTACMVFDDMLLRDNDTAKVVWDEKMQRMVSPHDLLKQLAQGGCHVGENEFMFKAPVALNHVVNEVPSQVVWDEELLQSPNSEEDLLLLLFEPATIAEHVEFMDQVTFSGHAQEVFASIHSDREAKSPTDEGAFYSCKVSESAAIQVLNKMPLPDVVWDEEPQLGSKSHGLLLQEVGSRDSIFKLLAHGECLMAMDDKPIAELVSSKAPIVTHDVIWDEEPPHGFDSQGSLQQHAEALDNQMQVSIEILCESVLWDEIPADSAIHEGLKEQLALGSEYIGNDKVLIPNGSLPLCLEVENDKVLTHIAGLSHFLEICETSNADEARKLVAEIFTPQSGLLQCLEISMSSVDLGLEETLALDDQLSCATLFGCNENLQLEEAYVVCFGIMQPSAGCVTDQFSPQFFNHQFQSHLCPSCHGAWAGQEMESDCKDSVICYEKQDICGSAHYLASSVALWRQNALSSGNADTKATCSFFNKILSWNRGGFSPGESELQLEQYKMVETQWDLGIPGPILNFRKLELMVGSSKRDTSEFMITATLGFSSSHSSRDTTELRAWYYKCIDDAESDEHPIAVSSLERALGLQIQQDLSANGNERTIVLKEIRLSLVPYVISWCTVVKYRAITCQNLCSLNKFKQDETSHGEDGLQLAGKGVVLDGKQRGRAFVQGQRCMTVSGISGKLPAVQELNHGSDHLVINEECQRLSGLHIVVVELQPRSVSTSECKLALITVRQWDPGIWRDACWQWDPGIITATAWGQAVFRGGGNVMTRICIRGGPTQLSPDIKAQPSTRPKQRNTSYTKLFQQHRRGHRKYSEGQRERKVFFHLGTEILSPAISSVSTHVAGSISPAAKGRYIPAAARGPNRASIWSQPISSEDSPPPNLSRSGCRRKRRRRRLFGGQLGTGKAWAEPFHTKTRS